MFSLTNPKTWWAKFSQKQQQSASARAAASEPVPVTLPYKSRCSYTVFPAELDCDAQRLCFAAAMNYEKVNQVADTTLIVNGAYKQCNTATVSELVQALQSAAPAEYGRLVNAGLAQHPNHQSDTAVIGPVARTATLRTALAYVMIARDTMSASGTHYNKHTPPTDVELFPQAVFSIHGIAIAPPSPPPALAPKQSEAATIAMLQAALAAAATGHTSRHDGLDKLSGSSAAYHDMSDRAVKRPRTDNDERVHAHARQMGAFNEYGEMNIEEALNLATPDRMPPPLEARMYEGNFGFQLILISKIAAKLAHGSHTVSDPLSDRSIKLDRGEKDPTLHAFLDWPKFQDALRKFITSWLLRFNSKRQHDSIHAYEEHLRRLQLRWPDRPTAAAEVDYYYRHTMAFALGRSGTINIGADGSRGLPGWKLDSRDEARVLGVPSQQLLPFCSNCSSAHAIGACPVQQAPHNPLFETATTFATLKQRDTKLLPPASPHDSPCFGFNLKGKCEKAGCPFPHRCAVCGDVAHHATTCTASGGGTAWEPPKRR